MTDTLVLVKNTPDAVVASALIQRLRNDGHYVHCMTDLDLIPFFKFCGCRVSHFQKTNYHYRQVINLSPSVICTDIANNSRADEKLGYGRVNDKIHFFNVGADLHYRVRTIGVPSEANLFQLLFGLANLSWHGEGYGVKYFPRIKTKFTVGLGIKNYVVRRYVKAHLVCDKLWKIPFKHNALNQMDEINRCKMIVTDDETIVHLSLALRKQVEYITCRMNYKFESFNSGNLHLIQ